MPRIPAEMEMDLPEEINNKARVVTKRAYGLKSADGDAPGKALLCRKSLGGDNLLTWRR